MKGEKPSMDDTKIGVTGAGYDPAAKYGKILIMGRAQTGKTTVANHLAAITGLKLLKTCTTRPRRSPDENTYHFYTPEEAMAIPMKDKFFYTVSVDGFERWTNRSDFLEAGIAILDTVGAEQAVRIWRAQGYNVTLLYCEEPVETRRTRWISSTVRSDSPDAFDAALLNFNHREQIEAPGFDRLEQMIWTAQALEIDPEQHGRQTVYQADDLVIIQTSKTDMDAFFKNFTNRLIGHGGRPITGFHVFRPDRDLDLFRENFTESQWACICGLFDLLPETTCRIQIAAPSINACVHPDAGVAAKYKTESEA